MFYRCTSCVGARLEIWTVKAYVTINIIYLREHKERQALQTSQGYKGDVTAAGGRWDR